jgi:hypothetical protein
MAYSSYSPHYPIVFILFSCRKWCFYTGKIKRPRFLSPSLSFGSTGVLSIPEACFHAIAHSGDSGDFLPQKYR